MNRWMLKTLGCALCLMLVATACQQKPDTLIDSGYDQAEMDAAIAKARGSVDTFIAELQSPSGESHAVKAPITDGDQTEHFWLSDVSYQNGEFQGTIDNDPGTVTNVKVGQSWTIKKGEISDWMYMRDGKMYGNYTMRPLLKTMPPEEAQMWESLLAEP